MKNLTNFKKQSVKFYTPFIIIIFAFAFLQNAYTGTGWYLQNSGINYNLNSVYFVNALTGYAVGDTGKIIMTTNGGINWIQQSSPCNIELLSVHFINENTGWAAGGKYYNNPLFSDYESVIRTTNGGQNWISVICTSNGIICYDIYTVDANSAFISTSGMDYFGHSTGCLFKTTNSGVNWQISISDACRTFHFLNANTGWAVCMYLTDVLNMCKRKFFMTTNAGANWFVTKIDSGYSNFNPYYGSIRFLNGTTGYFNDGFLKKTTNSGYNWTNCDSTYNIKSFYFVNPNTGWVTGWYNSQIRKTTNGGSNWTIQQSQNTNHLYSVYMVDALTGYAVGANGTIVKTVTGGVTSAEKIGSEIPAEFELKQNYPNPFNSITNIKFQIPNVGQSSQTVTIKVFDISGKEVVTLVNEKLNPGTYEVKFDSGNLPSGIYFYRMETEKFSETKKLILLK
ncbi:MAG: T9SS type A sorting domain-containing protein [Ignavibacteria bacterium]|nr:T9SS type A sorting domain-containing protein [Ignavibacteria bacterium]